MPSRKIPKLCHFCHKIFSGEKRRKFCSSKCLSESRKRRKFTICRVCGKIFEYQPRPSREVRGERQFCSHECFLISYRCSPRNCETCDKEFQPTFQTSKRFCSVKCGRASRKNGKWIQCETCGKRIYRTPVRLQSHEHQFCSHACQNIWQGRKKVLLTCITCGKDFQASPSVLVHDNPQYCSQDCYHGHPDQKQRLQHLNLLQRQHVTPNKLELTGYSLLDSMGLEYKKEQPIGRFIVDVYLPAYYLIIQWDGDYWHGHPQKYPDPDRRQCNRMRIDKAQNTYFRDRGYTVLRFWEYDVRQRPDWVIEQIQSKLRLK